MTRKGSQVQVLYGPPSEPLVTTVSDQGLVAPALPAGCAEAGRTSAHTVRVER